MARAAKDAGITINGTEAELFKMMEQGKVLAKDILPAFAKQLKATAHEGNALQHAIDKNLGVALGIARNNVELLSLSLFEGLKDSLKLVLDNFNLLAPKTKDLAFLLGKTLGGAVTAVTMPFVLFGAALADVWTLTKKITGVNDEMGKSLLALAAKVAGLVLGFKALFSVMKKVSKLAGTVKSSVSSGTASTGAKVAATGASKVTGPLALLTAGLSAYERFSTTDARNMKALEIAKSGNIFEGGRLSSMFSNKDPLREALSNNIQPKDVNVKVKVDIDEQGNWKGAVQNIADNAVMDAEDQRIQQALNSFHGGGY